MFARLFGQERRTEARAPQLPAGRRVYAVGDIHGRADLLQALHARIREDSAQAARDRGAPPRPVIVYLGDYIDRGMESRAVIDVLLEQPLAGFEAVYLKGNHEQSLLRFLDDIEVAPAWLLYGGNATLWSYGVRPPAATAPAAELERAQAELRHRLPERHRRFFEGLALCHGEGDYYFVHAGIRPGVPLARQAEEDLLWIRDEFLHSSADHGKIVVHGHSIVDRPERRPNRIGIDTGAFATGRLTCLVAEGSDCAFLQT